MAGSRPFRDIQQTSLPVKTHRLFHNHVSLLKGRLFIYLLVHVYFAFRYCKAADSRTQHIRLSKTPGRRPQPFPPFHHHRRRVRRAQAILQPKNLIFQHKKSVPCRHCARKFPRFQRRLAAGCGGRAFTKEFALPDRYEACCPPLPGETPQNPDNPPSENAGSAPDTPQASAP